MPALCIVIEGPPLALGEGLGWRWRKTATKRPTLPLTLWTLCPEAAESREAASLACKLSLRIAELAVGQRAWTLHCVLTLMPRAQGVARGFCSHQEWHCLCSGSQNQWRQYRLNIS